MGYFRPLSQTKFINDANLVRYYKFDGNSTDSVGGYNGTDNSVSYVTGKNGNALSTSGSSSSYVQAPITGLSTGASAFSDSLWFKTTANTVIFYGYGTVSVFGYRHSLAIVSNKLYFSGFGADLDSGVVVNDGVWHHGVVTYNGTTLKLYIDGVLVNSGSVSLNMLVIFSLICPVFDLNSFRSLSS